MSGFRVLLQSNQFILLLLLLLQFQSLGLDIDSRPAAEVCATHTISPGPKVLGFIMYFGYLPSIRCGVGKNSSTVLLAATLSE
ncbi:collectin-10-like protein [Cricetulus griseus]|uniref:Collectin-10-like protein n=1 Tax=Cricetulus griseus TaxID=10029 RepID=A0A061HTB3_CRIGR|nr:collectin-10-like protein [Cricetulus griseus]